MWLLLLCSLAFAEEQVVTIKEGEKAPFTGTLLNPEAVAKLITKQETDLKVCLANAEFDKRKVELEKEFIIKNREAELAQCTLELSGTKEIYQERIDFLQGKATTPEWKPPLYFIGGIITGVAVVTLSAWTLDKIQED